MRLACAALLLSSLPLAAQEQSETARRLILDASRALQAGNAARFLGYFDKRETPQFAQLRANLLALIETKEVATSVKVGDARVDGEVATFDVDWLLQLSPLRELGGVEERHQVIEVRVRAGAKPKIVFLEPVDFFRPVNALEPAPAP